MVGEAGSAGRGSRPNHHAREQRKEMSEAVRLCGDRSPVFLAFLPSRFSLLRFFPSSLPYRSLVCLCFVFFSRSTTVRPVILLHWILPGTRVRVAQPISAPQIHTPPHRQLSRSDSTLALSGKLDVDVDRRGEERSMYPLRYESKQTPRK